MKMFLSALAGVVSLLPAASFAATLDFTEVTSGYQGSNVVTLSNATVTTAGADIYVASPYAYNPSVGASGGFCGLTTVSGYDCSVDTTITFNDAVSDVNFQATAFGAGDSAVASIFSGTTLLASIAIVANGIIDFTGYSGVTSLFLDDTGSTARGVVYGAINFDGDQVSPVPLPASLPLLLAALGGAGVMSRRKKKTA